MKQLGAIRILMPLLGAAAVAAACSGGDDGGGGPAPNPLVVARAAVSGNAQSGVVGAALANPIRVVVTRDGAPEVGATVTWSAAGTGASVNPTSGTTDASGEAQATWTLAQGAGAQSAQAAVSGASGSPVGFTATGQPGPATQLNRTGGNAQSGPINTALPAALQVTAVDQFGNGVSGVAIAWTVTSGGGSVNPTGGNTGGAGTATTQWTLGATIGAQGAQAAAAGLTGSPVAFSATGQPPTTPVSVRDNSFVPAAVTIAAGEQVRWTWAAGTVAAHSVLSTGAPSFTSSAVMSGAGSTYAFTFTTPGVYTYECAVHGAAMSGTVTVN